GYAHRRINILGQHKAVKAGLAQKIGFPITVGAAENPETMHPGAARMTDGVNRLKLNRHRPGHPGSVAVAYQAMALYHVVAVSQPAPGPPETAGIRMMIGIEHPDKLAFDISQGRIDI